MRTIVFGQKTVLSAYQKGGKITGFWSLEIFKRQPLEPLEAKELSVSWGCFC